MIKKRLLLTTLLLFTFSLVISNIYAYSFYTYFTDRDKYYYIQFLSPFKNEVSNVYRSPFVPISSSFNKPRDEGSCPHVGVDFSARKETNVYFNLEINENRPAQIKQICTYTQPPGTKALEIDKLGREKSLCEISSFI